MDTETESTVMTLVALLERADARLILSQQNEEDLLNQIAYLQESYNSLEESYKIANGSISILKVVQSNNAIEIKTLKEGACDITNTQHTTITGLQATFLSYLRGDSRIDKCVHSAHYNMFWQSIMSLEENKKLPAIKNVRLMTCCTLKESKVLIDDWHQTMTKHDLITVANYDI